MAVFTSCSLPSPCTASSGSPIGLIRNASTKSMIGDFLNLLIKKSLLPLRADGNTLKLAVADDNSVIVAGGDAGAEFLAVVGFKVLLGSDKDVDCPAERIEAIWLYFALNGRGITR